jgi:CheY-like chemotaxis protein
MTKKRILVVDDEASITRGIRMTLEVAGGYEVRTENVAQDTMAAARDFQPDLVLLDIMMPEMDGGDVAAQLRDDPVLKDIPIVFLTALTSNQETGGHEMASGPGIYLAKPVVMSELTKCIERHARTQSP